LGQSENEDREIFVPAYSGDWRHEFRTRDTVVDAIDGVAVKQVRAVDTRGAVRWFEAWIAWRFAIAPDDKLMRAR